MKGGPYQFKLRFVGQEALHYQLEDPEGDFVRLLLIPGKELVGVCEMLRVMKTHSRDRLTDYVGSTFEDPASSQWCEVSWTRIREAVFEAYLVSP